MTQSSTAATDLRAVRDALDVLAFQRLADELSETDATAYASLANRERELLAARR